MDPWSLYFISGLVIAVIFCMCFCYDRVELSQLSPSWRYLYYRVTQGPCPSWTQPPTMRRQEQESFDNQTNPPNNQVFVVESGNFS